MNAENLFLKATKNSRLITIMTFVVGLLFAANSIINLILADKIYPTSDMYNSFLPNDCINLFFGVPILFMSVILALRQKKIGYIGWAGSLLFVLYNEIANLFAVRNTYSVIMNATIVLLGVVAIAQLLASLDYQKPPQAGFSIRYPKAYGVILIIMGLLFVARAIMNMVNVANGMVLPLPDMGVNIADLIICSLWIVGGILLFRKSTVGYIVGFISYFHGSMLFMALMVFMIIQPALCGTEFVMSDFIVIMAMSLTFLIPFVLLIRGSATDWLG